MRPAITGDARELRAGGGCSVKKWRPITRAEVFNTFKTDRRSLEDFVDLLNRRMAELFAGDDLPEPDPTAKAEEEPDYTCQKCGVEDGCIHLTSERLSIANRRIAQLTRERDHFREVADLSKAAREVARSRAIQDTKDAADLTQEETP